MNVKPLMGSRGDAYDNAMAESFFATLECELNDRRCFKTQAEARMALFEFIEGWYSCRSRKCEQADSIALSRAMRILDFMTRLLGFLVSLLISTLRTRASLQAENAALRHQLAVYQSREGRPNISPADRMLWSVISRLWSGWRTALYFVQPRTVAEWQKKRFRDYWRKLSRPRSPGRPRISVELQELIRHMWNANPTWGSPRIVGELRKLGISVAKSTVERYRPQRDGPTSATWKAFLD